MSQATEPSRTQIAATVLATWIGVQLVALVACAARVPFWSRPTVPTDGLALHVMLITQVVMTALLGPFLFRDWKHLVSIAASSVPFAFLAGLLCSASVSQIARGEAYALGWVALVAIWSLIASTPWTRALLVAITSLCALGGINLFYVAAEFAERSSSVTMLLRSTPVAGVVAQLSEADYTANRASAFLGVAVVVSVAVRAILRMRG